MEYYEHDVDNLGIEVGQNWSSEVISFPGGLGGRVASCHVSDFCAMRDARESSARVRKPLAEDGL